MMVRASDSGVQGVMAAQDSLANNAERLSNLGRGGNDPATPMIGMMLSGIQIQASASVIRTDDAVQKAVLDMMA